MIYVHLVYLICKGYVEGEKDLMCEGLSMSIQTFEKLTKKNISNVGLKMWYKM